VDNIEKFLPLVIVGYVSIILLSLAFHSWKTKKNMKEGIVSRKIAEEKETNIRGGAFVAGPRAVPLPPMKVTDDEDHILIIRQGGLTKKIYTTKENWKAVELGEWYVFDEETDSFVDIHEVRPI